MATSSLVSRITERLMERQGEQYFIVIVKHCNFSLTSACVITGDTPYEWLFVQTT